MVKGSRPNKVKVGSVVLYKNSYLALVDEGDEEAALLEEGGSGSPYLQ